MGNIFKNKNIFLYCTFALIIVFTACYFVTINKVSYAFEVDESSLYNSKIKMIEDTAKVYGEYNPDIFGENDYVYFTVGELIEKGVIASDNDKGELKDPNSDVKVLNDLKVKITNKDGIIKAEVLN